MVFRADLDAYAAYAPSADILEFFLHIPRAFFGIVVAFAVRFGRLAKDRAGWTSTHARRAISATVFNHFSRGSEGHVRNHGGKPHAAAVELGEEKSALSYESKP